MLPVESTAEGIGRYVGSYVGKNINQRLDEDKGARLVRYFGYAKKVDGVTVAVHRTHVSGWSSNKAGGALWRHNVRRLGESLGFVCLSEFTDTFGPRWAFLLRDLIEAMPLGGCYPSLECGLMASDRLRLRELMLLKVDKMRSPSAIDVLLKAADLLVFKARPVVKPADRADTCDELPDMRKRPHFEQVKIYNKELGIWLTHLIPWKVQQPF
jgi:hypothetical protein